MSLVHKVFRLHTFENVKFGRAYTYNVHIVCPTPLFPANDSQFYDKFKPVKMLYEGTCFRSIVYVEWAREKGIMMHKFEVFR